ncbi:translation initiation factor IF-2 [Helicovermis profundi]|uniref:Translation initiation factor IF-2 n=1 Tax=Helicovermis profundi TaxID=3065157 RepID=A0AAU9EW52_9FIRM|nr:translation initiation factor IF-2 [Clostridia bacterium S502]
MSKIRVYQLAKKMEISSKELIDKLLELGIDVHNHMSSIEDGDALIVEEYLAEDKVQDEEVVEEIDKNDKSKESLVDTFNALEDQEDVVSERKANKKNRKKKKNAGNKRSKFKGENELVESTNSEEIMIGDTILVSDFASKLNKSPAEIIMKLMNLGVMATLNQDIDFAVAKTLAEDYGVEINQEVRIDAAERFDLDFEDDPKDLLPRAPIVTVMGHVDHGKTSLLDAIRDTAVTTGEAGGITQHIGASEAIINDQKIVFLDTPGHEAFTSLRARGTKVTDIAILVVAADDGVMPQTIEAIDHAKAAGVPIIIAINKIDKPNANQDRVKQELSEKGVLIEEWGGDVISVPVSAKNREGIEQLLEMVLLVSEMLELKANPNRKAVGTIIEAKTDVGKGTVATVLVEKGTLNIGDPVVVGSTYGRVRAMYNFKGKKIKLAGPATAVEVTGLNDIPQAGDRFYVANDDKQARLIAEKRQIELREENLNETKHISLEDLFDKIKEGELKELNIIIKADVHGSIEALKGSLLKLSNEEVKVNIIHANIGTITESDILLASASNAIILGFNVRPSSAVQRKAEKEKVNYKTYQIIYEAIKDVQEALTGMLDPVFREVVLGKIQVRETFKVPNIGVICGGYVLEGKVVRNANVRIVRDGIIIHDGKISSLRRFKDDVKEVATGYECGIGIEKYNDIKINDEIEAYIIEEIPRK